MSSQLGTVNQIMAAAYQMLGCTTGESLAEASKSGRFEPALGTTQILPLAPCHPALGGGNVTESYWAGGGRFRATAASPYYS